LIERLCQLRIERMEGMNVPVAQGYLPLSVQGFEAKLSIKDDVSYLQHITSFFVSSRFPEFQGQLRAAFIERLNRQLTSMKERKAKYEAILDSCQAFAETPKLKPWALEKNQRSIHSATSKLRGVTIEQSKLERLLRDVENGAVPTVVEHKSAKIE
jgi:hypothetical protein